MHITRRTILHYALATGLMTGPTLAAPRRYSLRADGARIAFAFSLNGQTQTGTAPLQSADLRIDTDNLASSTADVTADISKARTGLFFATEALKSASVLDTRTYPTARFVSTQVHLGPSGRLSEGAFLEGALTLRGVTRKIRFNADLFRPAGSNRDELEQLEVRLKGQFDRRDFGAIGYADLVDPIVGLDIHAKISAAG